MYYEPEEFVLSGLPKLLKGFDSLDAVFATYNSVHGYHDGLVHVYNSRQGLRITVQSGCQPCHKEGNKILRYAMVSGNISLGMRVYDKLQAIGDEAQSLVEAKVMSNGFQADTPIFGVVYAGYTSFQHSFQFAKSLRSINHDSKVVILTCDCDLERKSLILDAAVASGTIDDYIVTFMCGGNIGMKMILNGLIDFWG